MVNKDFLKQVLNDEKKLLSLAECKLISVPKFDELSVRNIYPRVINDDEIMMYFPDSYPKDKGPSREYFFTILNSLRPEYMGKLVTHANK